MDVSGWRPGRRRVNVRDPSLKVESPELIKGPRQHQEKER